MPLTYSPQPFERSKVCSKYFNGTLHVVGLSSINNIFHMFADNIINHLSTIIMDAYLYPDLLHLPRQILIYPGFYKSDDRLCNNPVKHFDILFRTMSAGKVTLEQAEGTCYRRVIWGQGPSILYDDVLTPWRRQAAYLLRRFVHYSYKIPTLQRTFKARKTSRTLRITIFSRENSPNRQLSGEDLIASALKRLGHTVAISRSTAGVSLQQQLEVAMNTDVVIGLHGAGFANGLFASTRGVMIELKTIYGWNDANMALISDARLHTHVIIDIRSYTATQVTGQVDAAMVSRIVDGLQRALDLQQGDNDINQIVRLNNSGYTDLIVGPTAQTEQFDHILGPFKTKDIVSVCQQQSMHHYQRIIENVPALELHCRQCCLS